MKAVFVFVLGVFAVQSTFAQCIRSAPVVATAPVIQTNNVGATLADTLSLLTVSSLLSEKLPYDYPCGCAPYIPPYDPYIPPCGPYAPYGPYEVVAPYAPYEYIAPCGPALAPVAPIVNNCGCGCGGYGYNAYVL